ncbi:MAG: response regulator [Polaromonas sp.]|nr:response regulator [Polaromonas sp.]
MPEALVPLDAAALNDKRVLVVDDHPVNVRVLTRQLRQWGMRVASAESGALAIDVLDQGQMPDVVITDMHMPGMDGLELARHIRGLPEGGKVPLVLLSSGFMPGGAGSNPFNARLLKPARQNQLFEALARCLSTGTALPAPVIERVDVKKGITVLVADDNVVNLKVACGILARLGYDTLTVADGLQAVSAVAASMDLAGSDQAGQRFGAILMDLHMPGMDGIEATRIIQQRFGQEAPPIIALTADASIEDRERCAAAGMDDYLTKPLQVVELTRALARWTTPGARDDSETTGPAAADGLSTPAGEAAADASRTAAGPTVNFSRLEEFREFDPDLETVTEVINLFTADVPGRIAAIAVAHAQGDTLQLAQAAHTLKGSASNVGAEVLAAISSRVEELASEGVMPPDMDDVHRRLHEAWIATQAELTAWLEDSARAQAAGL